MPTRAIQNIFYWYQVGLCYNAPQRTGYLRDGTVNLVKICWDFPFKAFTLMKPFLLGRLSPQ